MERDDKSFDEFLERFNTWQGALSFLGIVVTFLIFSFQSGSEKILIKENLDITSCLNLKFAYIVTSASMTDWNYTSRFQTGVYLNNTPSFVDNNLSLELKQNALVLINNMDSMNRELDQRYLQGQFMSLAGLNTSDYKKTGNTKLADSAKNIIAGFNNLSYSKETCAKKWGVDF